MFNTKVTEISLMDLSHMVTQHIECTEGWYIIAELTPVFQQKFISLFYFFTTEPYLELPFKKFIGEHLVTDFFIWLYGITKNDLKDSKIIF